MNKIQNKKKTMKNRETTSKTRKPPEKLPRENQGP
jgi:hypothetical protein